MKLQGPHGQWVPSPPCSPLPVTPTLTQPGSLSTVRLGVSLSSGTRGHVMGWLSSSAHRAAEQHPMQHTACPPWDTITRALLGTLLETLHFPATHALSSALPHRKVITLRAHYDYRMCNYCLEIMLYF